MSYIQAHLKKYSPVIDTISVSLSYELLVFGSLSSVVYSLTPYLHIPAAVTFSFFVFSFFPLSSVQSSSAFITMISDLFQS